MGDTPALWSRRGPCAGSANPAEIHYTSHLGNTSINVLIQECRAVVRQRPARAANVDLSLRERKGLAECERIADQGRCVSSRGARGLRCMPYHEMLAAQKTDDANIGSTERRVRRQCRARTR